MFDIKQKTNKYMSVVVTHECNKTCPFCIDKYRGDAEYITIDNVIKAISFAKNNAIEDILLVGGEPTLHPNIIDIAKKIKENGFRVIMTTNYTTPNIVKQLDGIVDCFNISFYNQKSLPRQNDFESDITIHAIIHSKQLQNKNSLDCFIDKYKDYAHLKFSTLTNCNKWTNEHNDVSYLDNLPSKKIVLFDEMEGNIYRGCVIKRYDRILKKDAKQSYKFHVDGEIGTSWERDTTTHNSE